MKFSSSICAGSLLCGASVSLGAFGAHAWKKALAENKYTEVFETGAKYQMYGGLALIMVGIMQQQIKSGVGRLSSASRFLFAGSIIFPGSLYLICLTKKGFFGAFTPIGGISFIIAFGLIAYDAYTGAFGPDR